MYANPAGTEELFTVNTFTDFDKEVFFAIRATDGPNEAEVSNIVSIFIHSITTTTSMYAGAMTIVEIHGESDEIS